MVVEEECLTPVLIECGYALTISKDITGVLAHSGRVNGGLIVAANVICGLVATGKQIDDLLDSLTVRTIPVLLDCAVRCRVLDRGEHIHGVVFERVVVQTFPLDFFIE